MDIQNTAVDAVKAQPTGNKPLNRPIKLTLQPTKSLSWLLRGLQIIIALSLASVSFAQTELIMNGGSIYTDLGKDQFAAALYLETQQKNPNTAHSMAGEKRMEVRVLNNYSKRRWFNLWMQSISINNSRESFSESAQDLMTLMQAAKSAPQKGDFIEYLSSPDQGTSMRFNGTELVAGLPGEVFDLLLNTWIGAIPPTTSFKDEILGKQRNPEAVDLLDRVTTDPQRVDLAASWIRPPEPVAEIVAKVKPEPANKEQLKVKTAVSAKPKVLPESLENQPVAPKTATVATAALTADEPPAVTPKAEADSKNTKTDSLAKTSAETASAAQEVAADTEDEVDFSIAEALAMRDYTPLVVQAIFKKIRYPSRAIDKGYEGTVRMSIVVNKSGVLEKATVAQESKYSILNKAAIKATEKAAPFPELPAALNTNQFEITVPITFKLQ
ncbi:hypothetical protein U062_00981 [Gammaproteobacteria bacterium MOLA455]|nr:hypothetical protein U062_00981 [Gammaproteobacteria bacterium MOLA455]